MSGSTGASHTPPRTGDPLDRHAFPVDPWRLTERTYDNAHLGRNETLFAVANGYLGMRGNVEEGRETHAHGTFINGFHETWPIRHAEEAFGFARVGQTIVNVPDNKTMKLYVDDEPMLLSVADLESYDRSLDFRVGVLRHGGRAAAAQYWTVSAGRAAVLKLAHDEAFKPLSPGTVLTARMIRHLLEHERVDELDFGRGDDEYKRSWTAHRRQRIGLLVINPRRLAGLAALGRTWMGRARRRLRGA